MRRLRDNQGYKTTKSPTTKIAVGLFEYSKRSQLTIAELCSFLRVKITANLNDATPFMNTPRQRTIFRLLSAWTLLVFVLSPLALSLASCSVPAALCVAPSAHSSVAKTVMAQMPCCRKPLADNAPRALCCTAPNSKAPSSEAVVFTSPTNNRVLDCSQSTRNDAPTSLMVRDVDYAQPARRVFLSRTVAFSEIQSLDHPPPSGRAPPVA